jgi:hypothetical protein
MTQEDREFFESIVGDLNSGMGEGYNRFCCEQGITIAESLRNKDKIIEFHKMGWGQQKTEVPGLDDGHSGNTFNMACRLAIAYLPRIREKRIDEVIGQ